MTDMKKMLYSPCYLELLDSLKKIHAVLSLNPSPKPEVIIDSLMRLSQILSIKDDCRDFLYDYFCENNLFGKVANLVNSQDKNIKVQMLQTISIIIKNQNSTTWLYYIFANKGLYQIVNDQNIYEDDDLVAWASSLLKMLSFLLDGTTIKFFINPINKNGEFPLFSRILKLLDHNDSMVSSHARIGTLNILRIKDTLIDDYIINNIQTFYVLPNYLFKCWENTNNKINVHSISNLYGISLSLDHMEDYVYYLNDLFSIDFTESKHLLNYTKVECFDKLIDIINTPFIESNISLDNLHISESKHKKDNRNCPSHLTINTDNDIIQSDTPSSIASILQSVGDEVVPSDETMYKYNYVVDDGVYDEFVYTARRPFHPLVAAYILIQLFKMNKHNKCSNLGVCFEDLHGIQFFKRIEPFITQIFSSNYESLDSSILILLELINIKIDEINENELEDIKEILLNLWVLLFDSMDFNNFSDIKFRIITLRNLTALTIQLNAMPLIQDLTPNVKIDEPFMFEHLNIIWDEWLIFKSTCTSHCDIGYQALFVPQFRAFGSIMIQFGKKVDLSTDGVKSNKFIPPYYLLPSSPIDLFRYRLQITFLFDLMKKLSTNTLEQILSECPLVMDNWNIGFYFGSNLMISPKNVPENQIYRLGNRINLYNSVICRLDSRNKTYRYFITNDLLFILASSDKHYEDSPKNDEEVWGEITCLHPLWNITIKEFGDKSLTARILSSPGNSTKIGQKRQKYYDRERLTASDNSPPALVKFQLIMHFDEYKLRDQIIQHISRAHDKMVENCQKSFDLYMN